METVEIKSRLEKQFPGIQITTANDAIVLKPEDLLRIAKFLKESEEFKMDYLSSVTAVDYLEFLESVYHLYSTVKKTEALVLKVRVPRNAPKIPSLFPIYRGAEFQEREAYDMMGIGYEGHPDLRRIFMWEGFEGFPLRKDYLPEDADVLEWEDVEWLEKRGVKVPENYKAFARELKESGKEARAQKPTEKEI